MVREVGAQIAPPLVMQQLLPSLFREAPLVAKKRELSWQNGNLRPNLNNNWNPSLFSWDSTRFSVKQSSNVVERYQNSILTKSSDDAGENLTLKLGGAAATMVEEDRGVVRPSKKVRSGSPGSVGGGSYPMCQVDDCKTDLSNAKDYHRRHKVCEVHSKATKVLVGKQMQRFCQQCSRFHPLSEFDEGKRSCRRRLAGHNRRRRKTQPEDAPSQLLSPGNQGSSGNSNLDIVKLLAIFARMQGNGVGADKVASSPLIPDKNQANHVLGKIHSLRAANSTSRSSVHGGLDLNVSHISEQSHFGHPSKINGNTSTMDLLAVLSAAQAAPSPDGLVALSQGSNESSGDDKTQIACAETDVDINSHNQSRSFFSSLESGRNRCTLQAHFEVSKDPVDKTQPKLQLQLFSSGEDDSPPKMSAMKYLSSESSNLMDDRSPSCSPPDAQKLFPQHSAAESMKHDCMKHDRMPIFQGNDPAETSTVHGRISPLDLFKEPERLVGNGAVQSLSCQAGYACSSGSDQSPSSSNSDGQDRTGKISFKLFDKDPSSFPGNLRAQILNWLSNSPSEIESYIRPGCVVLSIYTCMSSIAWDGLERNLVQRVSSLVQCSESDFWRTGRFLVRTNRHIASHNDGRIHLCKSWKMWSAPELTYVSPIAIVSGQEASFILKGRNLTAPGTRIHCTYMGGYMSKEVVGSAYPGTIYDGSSMEKFSFHGGFVKNFGRCFIEVENGFKGNSFPVIIADADICQELRVLESDFEGDSITDAVSEDQVRPRSREDVLHFLNELGWLFQRKDIQTKTFLTNLSCKRFNYLLTFSVERDWPAVVKTLLDMLVERSLESDHSLMQESWEMLIEIQLLSRAVKRKCRKVVDLLLHYSVKGSTNGSKMYLFPPDSPGPGGITPLHIAASTQDSEYMVNALISDPQEIGLNRWNSILDESGQSPYMYAALRNNHSYNELVVRKLADEKNGQISITVGDQDISSTRAVRSRSCAQCARMDAHRFKPILRHRGLLQRPYIHSMLAIAAVCVCVCLLMRGLPKLDNIAPFMWENLEYGPR